MDIQISHLLKRILEQLPLEASRQLSEVEGKGQVGQIESEDPAKKSAPERQSRVHADEQARPMPPCVQCRAQTSHKGIQVWPLQILLPEVVGLITEILET
ncbi:MAG TPA: hypothetical protein VGG15_01110, partial [Terriglobales bacterium]